MGERLGEACLGDGVCEGGSEIGEVVFDDADDGRGCSVVGVVGSA